ncbi:penicillin-binding transpeptidase domain-containing protein, partial [Streptomyces celluloflavus]
MRSRCAAVAYEPGSTSKLMSMAAVLEEGAATPAT